MMEYKMGNMAALDDIFQRYKKPIFNYALRLLNNFADAEDVVGEVFLILTSKKDSYKPQAKFSTWLYNIAHNICITKIRKRKKLIPLWFRDEKSFDFKELQIPDERYSPVVEIEAKETARYIKEAIQKLPLIQKEAIILREYHNLSYEEIGKIMHCSFNKVKILIFRARKRLRKELLFLVKEESDV